MEYDRERHVLLWDFAHMRCIHDDAEFGVFVDKVRAAGYNPFEVEVPDWPPVLRKPLPIIIMSLNLDGGGGEWQPQGGPTAQVDFAWKGTHLALERDWWTEKEVRDIAGEMVPDRDIPLHRVAYAWQVENFDPKKHRVIRYWCNDHGVDIVDFWLRFYPTVEGELEIIETTNPTMYEEMAEGSFSPTRRCIRVSQLYILRNEYLGMEETPPPQPESGEREAVIPPPQPRFVHDGPDGGDETVQWNMHDGSTSHSTHEAIAALEQRIGRDVRPFSGIGLDQQVVAISKESMVRYLAENPVDRRQYIRDSGGRNFDCDDFALTLRMALIRDYGYNCCAVIAGDVHAWCAFILEGQHGLEIAFIEPQTDGLVTELTGDYSVERRCEVII